MGKYIIAAIVKKCGLCRYWNAETHGCKRNPSVEAWYENDYCSYFWEMNADDNYCTEENCEIFQQDLNCERCQK